ncbi:Riboflavin transporter 2-A-like protein [Dinothrombium tinctorium]|uniref:Riboflavin transporter n=1 Tax=Dinothrombium tinctorium TaxID=1965070 RepID=A0A3S4QUQ2_9ACAR|nr:Riboflavin transporter 2-A-like protein [Dinothrombium tinctorium]RWS08002.1 Riboflavin transporter 2-A-like protein [Dinothrombium tinctorium]
MSREYFIDFLVICFGISAWVQLNGLWVQTPVLVQQLPEGWKLSSYINFDYFLIHITLFLGTLSCILLSIFWKKTASIFGENHSIALLVLGGIFAIVDCTSSVLYLPFMANFKSQYFISYLIGEGFSGLIPSIVSLIQGIQNSPACVNKTEIINGTSKTTLVPKYGEPRFSTSVFFIILALLLVISWLAFHFLNKLASAKASDSNRSLQIAGNAQFEVIGEGLSNSRLVILLFIQTYICALTNGILPAIESFSALPYGSTTFHVAVNLSTISNPVACFIGFFKSNFQSDKVLGILTFLGSFFASYILFTALSSPNPPLQNFFGSFLIIVSFTLCFGIFTYAKTVIASILRNNCSDNHKPLFWCGVFTQLGSAFGAFTIFILVNSTKTFVASNPC